MSSKRAGDRFFLLFARMAVGRPWAVLLACLILTALATYASFRIVINTSTEGIFSAEVEFIRNMRAYEQIFPRKGDPIVAVVEAPTADRAYAAADSVAEKLRGNRLFQQVEVPGSQAYFRRAGLLFLDAEQLRGLRDQLYQARHALNLLSAQPNLLGISKFIDLMTAGVKVKYEMPMLASHFIQELAEAVRLQADGRGAVLSWSSLFGLEGLQESGKRRFVLAYPVVDKTTVKRVAPALDATRAAVLAVSSDDTGRDVRIRLTGQPALDQQELDAAFSGAVFASLLSFALVALTLVLGIRSWRLIVILIITLIVGSVWTSGLAAIVVGELNLISLAFGVLFFAVGVDFGTHLGLRYMEQLAGASSDAGHHALGDRRRPGDHSQRGLRLRRISLVRADPLPRPCTVGDHFRARHGGRLCRHAGAAAGDARGLAAVGQRPRARHVSLLGLGAPLGDPDRRSCGAGHAGGRGARNTRARRFEPSQPAGPEHRGGASLSRACTRPGNLAVRGQSHRAQPASGPRSRPIGCAAWTVWRRCARWRASSPRIRSRRERRSQRSSSSSSDSEIRPDASPMLPSFATGW